VEVGLVRRDCTFPAAKPLLRSAVATGWRNHRGALRSAGRGLGRNLFPGETARRGAARRSRGQRPVAFSETSSEAEDECLLERGF